MKIARIAACLNSSWWLWTVAVLGLAALAAISLVPADHSPPRTALPGSVEHFLAYAVVSAVAAFAFHQTVRFEPIAFLIIGYAAVLEFAQRWSPGRSPNLVDFAASSAGAILGIAICAILLRALQVKP